MVRCSNAVLCFVNIITILVAIPILCGGLYMKTEASSQCQRSLQWLIILSGVALLVLSLCGICGACCRVNFFLWIYLFFMFLLILSTIISMAFGFSVTNKTMENAVGELDLGNTTNWLQRWATRDWDRTERCMKETNLCNTRVMQLITKKNDTIAGHIFRKTELFRQLSPLQVGCCKPPNECGFTRVSDANWEAPKAATNTTNGDCKAWSNEGMCYGCDSCKAGMVESTRRNLRINAWINIVVLVILLFIYTVGCCAFHNNRAHRHHKRYG